MKILAHAYNYYKQREMKAFQVSYFAYNLCKVTFVTLQVAYTYTNVFLHLDTKFKKAMTYIQID